MRLASYLGDENQDYADMPPEVEAPTTAAVSPIEDQLPYEGPDGGMEHGNAQVEANIRQAVANPTARVTAAPSTDWGSIFSTIGKGLQVATPLVGQGLTYLNQENQKKLLAAQQDAANAQARLAAARQGSGSRLPSWVIPAAIGGGVLVLALVLLRPSRAPSTNPRRRRR